VKSQECNYLPDRPGESIIHLSCFAWRTAFRFRCADPKIIDDYGCRSARRWLSVFVADTLAERGKAPLRFSQGKHRYTHPFCNVGQQNTRSFLVGMSTGVLFTVFLLKKLYSNVRIYLLIIEVPPQWSTGHSHAATIRNEGAHDRFPGLYCRCVIWFPLLSTSARYWRITLFNCIGNYSQQDKQNGNTNLVRESKLLCCRCVRD
jgi:hypothetical protein